MAARIRAARTAEYDALEELLRRAARTFPGYCDELHALPGAFRISPADMEAGRVLVAELDDKIVGFAMWLPLGETTAHMEGLFVDPALWRGGLGSELLQAVSDTVMASGFRNLSVIALSEAVGFYRRRGFVRTGATSTPLGPALTMMREIDNSRLPT